MKDFELASLFGKLKYEENLIDSIYETEKNKSLVSVIPLLTAFFSTSIVQDFQDSPDDEEDTRSSHEYLNDLEKEYQARDLLAKSKRFFKKGTQRCPLQEHQAVINMCPSQVSPPRTSGCGGGGYGVGTQGKGVAARGGEWCSGSSRSGEGECFMFWPESSPEKFFGGGGGGGRRRLVAAGDK
nr:hypothetical protein [Tanacetum cinerariifolium]